MRFHLPPRIGRFLLAAALASAILIPAGPRSASAQAIVTAANGDPVTTYDVDEHVKLLKVFRKSVSRTDALEDAVADRLKYDEAKKWGVDASDADITATLNRLAAEAKLQPQAWLQAVERAHVDTDIVRAHLRALAAWDVLVRARNKTVGVSEEEISAQLAKGTDAKLIQYTLQQIVFIIPVRAAPAVADARLKEAQALRNRFTDCGSGLQLARAFPDVAIKERMTRTSDTFSQALRTLLADTPKGHLTTPERGAAGIELLAVCDKSDDSDQATLREKVQKELITNKLQALSASMYKDLRATAVVSKD